MAGSELKVSSLTVKLRASTLLEVVVSMVLIVVVFTIALTIYTNVLKLSLSIRKLKARAVLSEFALRADSGSSVSSQNFNQGELRVEQQVDAYKGNNGLQQVSLTAFDEEGMPLDSVKKIRPVTESVSP